MSQSTNDVVPTAIRLGTLWRLRELLNVTRTLSAALSRKGKEFDDVVKSGRTHLQDAVPIRLGQEFGAYAKAVQREGDRIERAAQGMYRLGIGGTAVGTGLNAHPEYHRRMIRELSKITHWKLVSSDNLFESMQSMADITDFSSALRTLAITMTRIANDFRLLSSGPATGFNELLLPSLQPGSSIMPGKVNPVVPEMTNMAMYHVMGCDTAIALAAQAGQLELNVMMPIAAHNLFEAMHVMTGALRIFTEKCVKGLKANKQKAEDWLSKNAVVATALNSLIGYQAAAALVKQALQEARSIQEIATEAAAQGKLLHIRTKRKIDKSEIQKAFNSLHALTNGGIF
jgi:fumarate hydratase class II